VAAEVKLPRDPNQRAKAVIDTATKRANARLAGKKGAAARKKKAVKK